MSGLPNVAARFSTATRGYTQLGSWRSAALLALLAISAAISLFFDLGEYRTLTEHEAFAAVPARDMLRSGDWIVPRFGGLPRLQKPPLNYWLLAATGWLFGEFSETTMRIPAAIASVLLAGLVGHWARCWYGAVAGFVAALVQLTSVWVITYGRKAEVDMLLCLLTTAALWLIADEQTGERHSRSRWCWPAIWTLLSVAWLAKFHYAPAMVLAAAVPYLVVQKRIGQIRGWLNPIGLLVFAAAALVWPMLLATEVPDAWTVWRTETVGRALGELQPRPVWFYLPHLLSLGLPWTVLAVAAVPQSWRRAWREGDARERFLWIWLIGQTLLLTVSVNKHRHYLFAAMPAVTLLAAQGAAAVWDRLRRGERLLDARRAALGCAAMVLAGIGAFGAITMKWPALTGVACALGGAVAVGGATAVVLFTFARPVMGGLAALGSLLAVCVLAIGWVLPHGDHRAAAVAFATGVRHEWPSEPICLFGLGEHPAVFYLDRPLLRIEELSHLHAWARDNRRGLVVTNARERCHLERFGRVRVLRTSEPAGRRPRLLLAELTIEPASPDHSEPPRVVSATRTRAR